MPSFAFWKSSKTDEAKAPLLTNNVVKGGENVVLPIVAKNLDLNPGGNDSGVFLFDEADIPQPSPQQDSAPEIDLGQQSTPIDVPVSSQPEDVTIAPSNTEAEVRVEDISDETADDHLLNPQSTDSESLLASPSTPTAAPTALHVDSTVEPQPSAAETEEKATCIQHGQEDANLTRPVSPLHEQVNATESKPARPTTPVPESHEGDSGVYLSDDESPVPQSRPVSLAMSDSTSRSRASSLSLKHTAVGKSSNTPQRTDSTSHRLKRPAELNLGANAAADTSKPRSELEKRYDLIRNSKTRSKAALRSPTELLNERLNMGPKKDKKEEVRVFTPPKPIVNGCWLPGPGAQVEAFTSTSVRARTEAGGRPAWWCKTDKLVVFDSIEVQPDGDFKINTRTSKGLSIARRRGDTETIVIPMDCAHCQEMLNRHDWKYDMQVCKRSICWDCKERCKWELEEEKRVNATSGDYTAAKLDGNRYRADSVLQDEHSQEEKMMQKVGIEKDRPMSPIETLGGIEERLGSRETAQ